MASAKQYFTYIMSNASRTLYTGVTSDLVKRVWEHKNKAKPGFTSRYHVTQLVHYGPYPDPQSAIAREKEIKGWRRARKIALVTETNPTWRDLSDEEGVLLAGKVTLSVIAPSAARERRIDPSGCAV